MSCRGGTGGEGNRMISRTLVVGSLNVRGCSGEGGKREQIGSLFERRKMDVLALSETKIRGKRERNFGKVKGKVSGVMRGRAREGVAILLKEELLLYVTEWREVSARMI